MTTTPTGTPTASATPPPLPSNLALPYGANNYDEQPGDVATGIQIQNLSDTNALTFDLTLYDSMGNEAFSISKAAAPEGAPNVYLPTHGLHDGLPAGVYSALVDADGPIGSIVRTDWNDTGAAGIYSHPAVSDTVAVPWVVRAIDGESSIISIQNAGDETASVTAAVYSRAISPTLVANLGPYMLEPGAATRVRLQTESEFISAGSFEGWMQVMSDGQPLAVQSYVRVDVGQHTIQGMHAFEGVPLDQASDRLLVPLFRSGQRGIVTTDSLDTRIVVANPFGEAVDVSVEYRGSSDPKASAACNGGTFNHGSVMIPAYGIHIFDQSRAPGAGHDIPLDCFGTAIVQTDSPDQRVIGVVLDSTNGNELLSAFAALPASAAAGRVALPLIRRAHFNLTTGIQVMNASDETATVNIAFSSTNSATDVSTPIVGCTVCSQVVAPYDSYTWWPGAIAAIPDGTFGSATVTSNSPVVVLVNDYPLLAHVDPATYIGIPAQLGSGPMSALFGLPIAR